MHIAFRRGAACYVLRTVRPFVEAASRIPVLDAPRRDGPAVRGLFKFYATFNLWSIFLGEIVEKRNREGRVGWTSEAGKTMLTRDAAHGRKWSSSFCARLRATIILPSRSYLVPTEYSKGCSQDSHYRLAFEVSRRRNEVLDDGLRRISVCREN